MNVDIPAVEHAIEEIVEVNVALELDGETLVATGFIDSPEQREAVLDVLDELLPGVPVLDNLTLAGVMPAQLDDYRVSETESTGMAGAEPGLQEDESLEPGDFTDQALLFDPMVASGPSGTHSDDDVSEGDEVYVPPTDPPRAEDGEVLGGFQTTSDEEELVPGSEFVGGPADSALEDAVIEELHQDASTNALRIHAVSREGIIYLRGTVDDIDDVENAQAVAARVPGVVEVREELQMRAAS